MKISRVEIFTAHLPLDREISRFGGKISHLEELYIKLTGEDGAAGWGEARGNAAHISGETPAGMEYVFKELLAPLVIGKELRGRAAVLSLVHRAVEGNGGAKSALDTALHDLAARAAGVPLYLWFGGKRLPDVKGSACIAFCSPGEAAERAHEYAGQGFANLMIRVGGESFSEDLERVKAVRDAAGEGISLAVDSGQAWTAKQAVGRIRMLEAFDIECAEQPVKARDFTGMAEVARGTRVALMADESLGTLEDGMNLIRLGAAGMFHIQLSRAGGFCRARQMIALTEAAHLPYVLGEESGGMLSAVAAAHLALASAPKWAALSGTGGILDDPTPGRVHEQGKITVPDGPGLGVAPDESKLQRVASLEG